jgi:hypothetical protein
MMTKDFDEGLFLEHSTDKYKQETDDHQMDLRNDLKKRLELNKKHQVIRNLRMILECKFVTGTLYIKALLLKIRLIKEVFISEIEKGNETIIPNDLSQN